MGKEKAEDKKAAKGKTAVRVAVRAAVAIGEKAIEDKKGEI